MTSTSEANLQLVSLWKTFTENHEKFEQKGNKSAARKARTALNDLKKLITPYRKASVEECKVLTKATETTLTTEETVNEKLDIELEPKPELEHELEHELEKHVVQEQTVKRKRGKAAKETDKVKKELKNKSKKVRRVKKDEVEV